MKKQKDKTHRPISSYSASAPFFSLATKPCTARYAWTFIFTIIKDFFFLQLFQKFHLTKRPVINVETAIDDKIPFLPDQVKDYLSFVQYFMKPMDMMKKQLGFRKSAPYNCLYLKFLTRIYKNSASIYRYCMTTTSRPKYYKTRKFRTIHFFDPHLLCVPSIHVAIAAGVSAWFKQCFKLGILPEKDQKAYLEELETQATKIVESVLFIKQHSVNCIPLALYMLSSTMNKSFFSVEDATAFIDRLFRDPDKISPEVRKEIIEHFYYMYERTLLESRFSANWQNCIRHWLSDYTVQTGQQI